MVTTMTKEKALLRGLSIYIGIIVAILSLVRGKWWWGVMGVQGKLHTLEAGVIWLLY